MLIDQLTASQIAQFKKNGFIIFEQFLPSKHLNKIKKRIEPLFRGDFETGIEPDEWNWRYGRDNPQHTRQICNAWKSDKLIREIVCHEAIGRVISQLMEWRGTRLIQDNVLWKPSGAQSLTFHQDASYDDWVVPQIMATCWIALDDTYVDSGTLEFVAGSHKWGLSIPPNNFMGEKNHKLHLEKYARKNKMTLNFTKVLVPAGGASFHHGLIWHGSEINKTKNDRRALVSHCVPEDAKFHDTNCGGTGRIYRKYKLNNSNRLENSFFPLIWSETSYEVTES